MDVYTVQDVVWAVGLCWMWAQGFRSGQTA